MLSKIFTKPIKFLNSEMRILVMISCLLIFSCRDTITVDDLEFINGYWEIEEVEFPDGNRKSYGINTIVDYIEYDNKKGYRKKVQPRLDGSFVTSDDAESFEIVEKSGKFMIHYKNDLSQWEEEIKALSAEKLVIESQEGVVYHYKKFEGILETKSGKKE